MAGPKLSGDQFNQGFTKDDLLAGEQYGQERRRVFDDELREAAKPKQRSVLPGPPPPDEGLLTRPSLKNFGK